MNNLIPVGDVERMAQAVAKSGLFGVKSPEQAMALMLVAQAEGLHPATAARDYHIIQGRPALKTDAMMARFQSAGGKIQWGEYTDDCVSGTFSHPQGGSLEVKWTMQQAKAAGLTGKDNWKNYPRAMLRARVVSEGIRAVYPGCVVGVYTPEEVQDFTPDRSKHAEKDMGSVELAKDELEEAFDATPKDWVLTIPGKEECPSFSSKDEWIEEFVGLVERLSMTNKIDLPEKHRKAQALKEANQSMFTKMGIVEASKVYAEVAKLLPRVEGGEVKKTVSEANQDAF